MFQGEIVCDIILFVWKLKCLIPPGCEQFLPVCLFIYLLTDCMETKPLSLFLPHAFRHAWLQPSISPHFGCVGAGPKVRNAQAVPLPPSLPPSSDGEQMFSPGAGGVYGCASSPNPLVRDWQLSWPIASQNRRWLSNEKFLNSALGDGRFRHFSRVRK